ncbi:MAG: transglutaminase-like domain-containing protein [Clostridia bacterium]
MVALWLCLLLLASGLAEILLPEATGDIVHEESGTTVDASHADSGYIMVKQKKTGKKLKLRISLGKKQLTYDLNSDGEYEVFPLQMGNGKYKLQVFAQVSGNKYSPVSSLSIKAELTDEKFPYLYPNQYVNYTADTLSVQKANEICQGLSSDQEKFQVVYDYVISHMVYDYVLAITVQKATGYLPELDKVYQKNMGICFDFAATMASMLRSQGVPTRLVIGFADKTYHAWNDVYVNDEWTRCDATSAVCGNTIQNYTVERMY